MASQSPRNQRRTPKQARSRAACEAIVEAAAQILERGGADALTTNAVAERAGVSIGTLYQYFPDKQAILIAAARRELGAGPLATRAAALVSALIATLERLRGASPVAVSPSLPTPQRTRRRPAAWERRLAELAADWLTILAPTPALRPIPVRRRRD
jgi:AcrR family transcriptional regulator